MTRTGGRPRIASGDEAGRLLKTAQDLVAQGGVPGAAVAVRRAGRSVIDGAAGFADLAATTPLAAGARFPVYSVTKTFIAAAVLRLVERGVVVLDAPIQRYLPELALPATPTVRQLLRHTGGIPDYGGLPEYHEAVRSCPERPWSANEFLDRTLAATPAWAPGVRFAYSNIGYMLLRLLLERLSGGTLATVLATDVFGPLGLCQTTVLEGLDDMHGLTPGYSTLLGPGDAPVDVAPAYHPGWVSHGLVASTAPELALAIDGLFAGRLLGAEMLAAMAEPVPVNEPHPLFDQPAYGLGLMLDAGSTGLFAGHAGGGPGYSIGVIHLSDGDSRVTSAALVNRDDGLPGLRLAAVLARQAAAEPQRPIRT